MKKFPIVLAAVALIAAGCFAAASIASGGSFVRMLTGTTATTETTHTDTGEHGGRRVALCHQTGPKKHPRFHTITVDQHAVQAHLGHGDLLGACAPATTTTASTTTSSAEHGKGNGKGHGKP